MRLVSWIGGNDIKAQQASDAKGPIHSTTLAFEFSEFHFLYNYDEQLIQPYIHWFKSQISTNVQATYYQLKSPTDFNDIYLAVDALLSKLTNESDEPIGILISPGTPAMQAVWILLGKTKYPVEFFQSSKEQGAAKADIPFDIAAEFIPLVAVPEKLVDLVSGRVAINAAFDDIITNNPQMLALKAKATILAERDVPVLIYGESGTGKELFATAIHNASLRANKEIVAVNCGAIPDTLIDSAFFGHKRGAFTGAHQDKKGFFEQADGGTLFLDEFGELKPDVQVRLLRILQSGEVTPVGASAAVHVNVRIIAATNKDLSLEVAEGRFREDLFYRIAVGVLLLPSLRHRSGDLRLIAEHLLTKICIEFNLAIHKKYSPDAIKIIQKQPWHGNVRELQSAISRAVLWSAGEKITATDIEQSLFSIDKSSQNILGQDIAQGVDLQGLLDRVEEHYVRAAWEFTHGQKIKAAELVGLGSYQNLDKRLKKYKIN